MGFIGAVVVLEAGPVYHIFMSGIHGTSLSALLWGWAICSFSMVLGLCGMAVVIPLRIGEQRLS